MSTTRIHRMSAFGLAALATAALVTGCSNSTDKPAAAGQATGAATGLAGSAATGVPAVAGSAGSAGGAAPSPVKATGGGKFCQQVADSMNNDVLSNPPENSDDIKTQVKAEQALEAVVMKSAPSAIKPDLTVLFGALDTMYTALAKVDYDYTKVDPALLQAFADPKVAAAEQDIDDYVKNTCGIDTDDPDDPGVSAVASPAS